MNICIDDATAAFVAAVEEILGGSQPATGGPLHGPSPHGEVKK
jgi:hypothetical protein